MRLRVLVLAAGLLWPVSSFSQDHVSQSFETGYQLYEDCNAALGSPQNIFCMGYVMGVSDSLDSQKLMCVPQEDSAAQEMSGFRRAASLSQQSALARSHRPLR